MKILNGKELAAYIKQRQAKQVRALIQAQNIQPKLAIIKTIDDPVIGTYVKMKKRYGADIQVDVDIHEIDQKDITSLIEELNQDQSVHGIIVQLPLADMANATEILNLIDPKKDVDGLSDDAVFDPATPTAILWLLDGYNVNLAGKKIALVGRGRLVGAPLNRMLLAAKYDVEMYGSTTEDMDAKILAADVVISATGKAGLVSSALLKEGAVAIDAGVAEESGKTVGDFAEDVYQRDDITVSPKKGGVGPLTVTALFENVIRAAM